MISNSIFISVLSLFHYIIMSPSSSVLSQTAMFFIASFPLGIYITPPPPIHADGYYYVFVVVNRTMINKGVELGLQHNDLISFENSKNVNHRVLLFLIV